MPLRSTRRFAGIGVPKSDVNVVEIDAFLRRSNTELGIAEVLGIVEASADETTKLGDVTSRPQ